MMNSWEHFSEMKKEIDEQIIASLKNGIVIFGCGVNGQAAFERLKKEYHVQCFCDNNKRLWRMGDTERNRLPIIAPEQIIDVINNGVCVIATQQQHYNKIIMQLKSIQKDLKIITYMEYLTYIDFDKMKYVYENLLYDEFSKRVFSQLLLCRMYGDLRDIKEIYSDKKYYAVSAFQNPDSHEVFVDCGAYVGDSIETYLFQREGIFQKIYAFEPFQKAFDALKIRKERLCAEWMIGDDNFVIQNMAVGMYDKNKISFVGGGNLDVSGTAGRILEEDDELPVVAMVTLDSYFSNRDKPTYIKADIEGEEFNMLLGSRQIISGYKPLLGICIYHRSEDLYEIPLLIHNMNCQYKMEVRHHTSNFCETVLYCY